MIQPIKNVHLDFKLVFQNLENINIHIRKMKWGLTLGVLFYVFWEEKIKCCSAAKVSTREEEKEKSLKFK